MFSLRLGYGRHRTIEQGTLAGLRRLKMKLGFYGLLLGVGLMAALPSLRAQAPGGDAGQTTPTSPEQKTPATAPANIPFPEDTTTVPVIPTTQPPPGTEGSQEQDAASGKHLVFTDGSADPVRSPDDASPETASADDTGSTSSRKGLDSLLPSMDDEQPGKKHKKDQAPEHQETAREDIQVGGYYLDKKNWKAALSRFQSAMVLDPENPEVYWGMAEAARNLGDLAQARDYLIKLVDYDPDGPHGKQARKLLKDPALMNAKAATPAPTQTR
jgi:hypothetical protein